MIDPTPTEIDGMLAAGKSGGEYLEELRKTDLVTMTPNEWSSPGFLKFGPRNIRYTLEAVEAYENSHFENATVTHA